MTKLLSIDNLSVRYGNKIVLNELNWTIASGQHVQIAGASGSGKTTLAKAIAGLLPIQHGSIQISDTSDNSHVVYVPNWYQFTNSDGDRNFYYQQRYNSQQNRQMPTVGDDLKKHAEKKNLDLSLIEDKLVDFGLKRLWDSQLIELSSGEHKKLQLIKSLWQTRGLLIIDQPYTGLDTASRQGLNAWLDELASSGQVQLMIISNDRNMPEAINTLVEIKNGQIVQLENHTQIELDADRIQRSLPDFLKQNPPADYQHIAKLSNIRVRYGDKVVLDELSWTINPGDKWLLQGPNGSGKSTLLSLITGDHPQSYGLDITLFGKARGSGESIWDIKDKIGMISPEMLWYFDQNATVWHTIASGFYESVGWFLDVTYQERVKIEELLRFFDLQEYKDQLLHTLPLGKQRLTMLARCLVKNPPLLVLDEPCQGLDTQQTLYFNAVVDELCAHGKTLVYVGHYLGELPKCIEQYLELENGRVKAADLLIENIEN